MIIEVPLITVGGEYITKQIREWWTSEGLEFVLIGTAPDLDRRIYWDEYRIVNGTIDDALMTKIKFPECKIL